MNRRGFLGRLGAGAAALGCTRRLAAADRPPNIILVLADDVGWGDFACYNAQGKIPTPNLDRLARQGMRFTDAHTPAALCAPTRYTVATGNYTWRGRMPGGTWGWNAEPQFLPGQQTVGHLLQAAGYRTALFGKLHFGGLFERLPGGGVDFTRPMKVGPRQWGFDYSYVLLGGHQAPPFMFFEDNQVAGDATRVVQLQRGPLNGGMVPTTGPGLPDWDSTKVGASLVEKAIAFIDRSRDVPFYIHLSTDGAHSPYTPPETLLGTPLKGVTKMTPHTDMVMEVDVLVGKLVEALEQRGLLDTTLIVVTSDNGGIPTERAQGHDAVGGLRGSKSYIYEGGHRVPLIAHWPGHIAPGAVRHQLVGAHDVVPTFVELAGGPFAADQMLDSVSLAPVLLGRRGDDQPVRQHLLIQSSPGRDAFTEGAPELPPQPAGAPRLTWPEREAATNRAWNQIARKGAQSGSDGMAHALREAQWKLVFDIEHNAPAALYNLADDLAEQRNLLGDAAQADRVRTMTALYREIRASRRSTPAAFDPPRG